MRLRCWVIALATILLPHAGYAGTVTLTDGTFNDADWELTTDGSNITESLAGQFPAGGNPGEFRRIRMNSCCTGVKLANAWNFNVADAYDPGTQGAIETVDFSGESILLPGSTLRGTATVVNMSLRQGGNLYINTSSINTNTSTTEWLPFELTDLSESDFGLFFFDSLANSFIVLPTANPDFSASGAEIEFGFRLNRQFSSNFSLNFDVFTGIDNWEVEVNTAEIPEPGTIVLVLGGGALLLLTRR